VANAGCRVAFVLRLRGGRLFALGGGPLGAGGELLQVWLELAVKDLVDRSAQLGPLLGDRGEPVGIRRIGLGDLPRFLSELIKLGAMAEQVLVGFLLTRGGCRRLSEIGRRQGGI